MDVDDVDTLIAVAGDCPVDASEVPRPPEGEHGSGRGDRTPALRSRRG